MPNLRGHSYDKPYSYMREYLPKMKSALYRAPEPKERVPVVLAALHPKMLALCAAEADGTHTYFVPPEHTAMARAAIGPKPLICVEQAVILDTDAAKARATAREYMKTYVPRLPNYTNALKALGWADKEFENGCSDRAGRRDRRLGHREADSRPRRGASEGRRESRVHPAGYARITNCCRILARWKRSHPESRRNCWAKIGRGLSSRHLHLVRCSRDAGLRARKSSRRISRRSSHSKRPSRLKQRQRRRA